MLFRGLRHIHFVGIGGIGMSGIAEVLLSLGENFRVTGSDLKRSQITERLESMGAVISEGHKSDNILGSDVIVTSSAVRDDNPEVVAARQKQIPVIPRAEMLAELMRLYRHGIAVAGTHGKTTTTSMIAHLMTGTGFDPSVVVGGRVASLGSNARHGQGEYIIVEADESDGSLLLLTPTIAVLTNIDADHLDHFTGGIEQIKQCFVSLCQQRTVLWNHRALSGRSKCASDHPAAYAADNQLWFGGSGGCVSAGDPSGCEFRLGIHVRAFGGEMGKIKLPVPGLHNVQNALATVAVGLDLGIKFENIAEVLAEFRGAERRFQIKGEKNSVMVVDDYGHHPTEIKATLAAARTAGRRVVTLFQPHRYTRTRDLKDEFARSFYGADVLLITDIYAASEDPIDGISSRALAEQVERFGHRHVEYIGGLTGAATKLKEVARPGDLVLTLGAGNVYQAGDELLKIL